MECTIVRFAARTGIRWIDAVVLACLAAAVSLAPGCKKEASPSETAAPAPVTAVDRAQAAREVCRAAVADARLPEADLTDILDQIVSTGSALYEDQRICHRVDGTTTDVEVAAVPALLRKYLTAESFEHYFPEGASTPFRVDDRINPRILQVYGGRERHAWVQDAIFAFLDVRHDAGDDAVNVLLIGDSIRMRATGRGWGPRAYELLADEFNFIHIPHNTGRSEYVFWHIDNWVGADPDVVLMNAGLHDLIRRDYAPDAPTHTSLEDYELHLERIVERVLAHESVRRLVLLTNTPVREDLHNDRAKQQERLDRGKSLNLRFNSDIEAFNAVMVSVADRHGLEVIDLNAALWEAGLEASIEEGVHLTRLGEDVCAQRVAAYLRGLDLSAIDDDPAPDDPSADQNPS
jgi:hypothetical protein